MERPTCKTCPYWDGGPGPVGPDEDDLGACRRYPKQVVPTAIETLDATHRHINDVLTDCMPDTASLMIYQIGTARGWPEMDAEEWCGEHPDFPTYLQATRDTVPREKVKADLGLTTIDDVSAAADID